MPVGEAGEHPADGGQVEAGAVDAASEEGGMAHLADWLRPHLPGIAITHVPSGDPLLAV